MASSSDTVHDEERLPWLETADEDYQERPSIMRMLPLIMGGLVLIALLVFGYVALSGGGGKVDGNGQLIAAQEGDYKVKPEDAGGRKVEGEGDTSFATSEGKGPKNAKIDLKQMPEAPVTLRGGKPIPAGTSSSALVQLGSFPTAAAANGAWAAASKRFAYVAPLGHSVEQAAVNGRTVFRLRVNAGSASAATELCGKLKVAGEACFVPPN
ncbi:MAG: SPOR domain-containing protein [Sphingomonas sp.]|uniref:SPOR domain-containing protein n=1 Tax=Sphingomonas sp. TaxID=28214 RepID=UPI002600DC65|nr:SPOR domain-containing protein [Sphingomonas sp.]MBY0285202.1 SPOR domain-containing protein [Sphingomonas sp.]